MSNPTSLRARLSRARWPALVTGAVLLAALAGLVLVRPGTTGRLDPEDASPHGARALAQVLRGHGVDVRVHGRFAQLRTDLAADDAPVTVVLARPDLLAPGRATELADEVRARHADLVVVGAGNGVLTDLGLPAGASSGGADRLREPACSDPLATRAGTALGGAVTYSRTVSGNDPVSRWTGCYPVEGRYAVVVLDRPDGTRTTLLGSGAALTNDRLADAGDAALAVGALGRTAHVAWWTPDPLDGDAPAHQPTLSELVPGGVRFAVLQLLVVLAVVVLWRGRRLGRLVPEPLPVVVRAVETTRGRGQLYRRARARGRAAQVLRGAAGRRLAVRCGLPRTAPVEQVAAAVAAATGRPATEITRLLVGGDPPHDAALVELARELDALETEVHRP